MKEGRKEKVVRAIKKVVELLEREELAPVALAVFRVNAEKPSDRWSLFNRMLMFAHGTDDARGYRQWKQVGRYVKKGAKAFHILVPIHKEVPVKNREVTRRIEELQRENCDYCSLDSEVKDCNQCPVGKEIRELKEKEVFYVKKLVSFKAVPVFRKEDTDGKPLPEDELQKQLKIPCEFEPLIQELGLTVKAMPFDGKVYGYYAPYRKEIALASPDLLVFLHELCHAVDERVNKPKEREIEECVAELSAAVIAYLLGYKVSLKHVKHYLHSYGLNEHVLYGIFQDVERVVSFVVERTGKGASEVLYRAEEVVQHV